MARGERVLAKGILLRAEALVRMTKGG